MKRFFCLTLVCAVPPVQAEGTVRRVGDRHSGFVVTDVREFGLIGADAIALRHDKTGALPIPFPALRTAKRPFEKEHSLYGFAPNFDRCRAVIERKAAEIGVSRSETPSI